MKSQITVLMIILLVLMHHASVSVSEGKSLKQGRIQEKWRVGLEGSVVNIFAYLALYLMRIHSEKNNYVHMQSHNLIYSSSPLSMHSENYSSQVTNTERVTLF